MDETRALMHCSRMYDDDASQKILLLLLGEMPTVRSFFFLLNSRCSIMRHKCNKYFSLCDDDCMCILTYMTACMHTCLHACIHCMMHACRHVVNAIENDNKS
ncbi:hypothetical protein WUBG_11602 [Wuchereria bancrofti]|uniref:Uncharacterized protein n=1 Tax=Wuchereria bancrofti TaxID=6293 RepID=J9EKE0_WUCBA|nr:hypothetical protein WUBG_11602 [Wuchereria bancrofti]